MPTPGGPVTRVATRWGLAEWLGRVLVRLGFRRMTYAIAPGLYAVGQPDAESPVLVTANYKLTFDLVRKAVAGLDTWLLVLDSRGVNVWCAAGKGTFGTSELIRRVEAVELDRVVTHRRLIVPQLGAPSVAAHEVLAATGFGVVFGPIRARDIPAFIDGGYQATPEMRRVRFDLGERLEVAWLELATAGRMAAVLSALVLAAFTWNGVGFSLSAAWSAAAPLLLALWSGILAGTLLFATLLPWLPGRMFALRGAVLGGLVAAGSLGLGRGLLPEASSPALLAALGLLVVAVTSYLAANYTGSTTFTSLSGVRRELRVAVPAIAAGLVAAALLPGLALLLGALV
jgi:hypothetical protein